MDCSDVQIFSGPKIRQQTLVQAGLPDPLCAWTITQDDVDWQSTYRRNHLDDYLLLQEALFNGCRWHLWSLGWQNQIKPWFSPMARLFRALRTRKSLSENGWSKEQAWTAPLISDSIPVGMQRRSAAFCLLETPPPTFLILRWVFNRAKQNNSIGTFCKFWSDLYWATESLVLLNWLVVPSNCKIWNWCGTAIRCWKASEGETLQKGWTTHDFLFKIYNLYLSKSFVLSWNALYSKSFHNTYDSVLMSPCLCANIYSLCANSAAWFSIDRWSLGHKLDEHNLITLNPHIQADVAVLEEPEHLNWYHHGRRWTDKFKHVVGVIHTNYLDYAMREEDGERKAKALAIMNQLICRIHCHKVDSHKHSLCLPSSLDMIHYPIWSIWQWQSDTRPCVWGEYNKKVRP